MALSPQLARQLQAAPALTDRHARVGDRKKSLADEMNSLTEASTLPTDENSAENLDVWVHSHFHAKGGQKKKALHALSKHKAGSVHRVPEVEQICSSTSRISVKLEYYRDHLDQHEPLLRKVEEGFMCQESGTGEPIVNVAKLRCARRRRRSPSPGSPRPKSQGTASRAQTARTSTPASARERSMAHRERISSALRRAQLLQLEKRTEYAWRLQMQHNRQERSQRERMWLAVMETFAVMATVKQIQVLWRNAKAQQSSITLHPAMPRALQKPLLKERHLETLKARILLMQKEERKRQRHEAIWKEWKKLLRSLEVWIKFRLPLRKRRSIHIIKSFMECSARAYMLRRTVKNFVKSVLMVQRALRHQAHIFRTIQRRILEPYVWATETQLLCDAFRMRKAEASARIEAYMEEVKLKEWERDVKLMCLDRAHVWREGYQRFRPQFSKMSDGENPSVQLEEDGTPPVRHVVSAPARVRHGRGSQLQKILEMQQPQSQGGVRKTLSIRKSLHGRNFLVMDTLRMDPRDCEEITRQMLLNSVDAWWAHYRVYKAAEPMSTQNWISWRQDFVRRPDALVWDPPEVLKYPEMSFSVQGYQWLHKEVEMRLREKPEFRSLIGEGF